MDIYWIQDHEQKGPLPEVEVISMLEAGLIPENARAWHAGCPEWVCIRDLPALKGAGAVSREEGERRNGREERLENAGVEDVPALSADADCLPEEGGEDAEEGVPLVVPYAYVRFLGRMADVMMHMTLYLAVLRVSGAAFNPGFLPGSYEALLYLCLPMILMETAFLGTLGTTPGKAMLGVSVRDYRGRRLSFPMAFRRSLFVMVLGLGCFAPSLMRVTDALARFASELKGELFAEDEAFDRVRELFRREKEELDTLTEHTERMLENAFLFLEDAFGESQEMVAFVTELNANYYSVWFISENGCDLYYRYNKGLLFDERRHDVIRQMDEVESMLNAGIR